jgi:hypothetical protein
LSSPQAGALQRLLHAETRPPISVLLPRSASRVSIGRVLRTEKRHADVVERTANCWAPNKPSIDFRGTPVFPEFVLVRLLEEAGWNARWVKYWGRREFCLDVGRVAELPPAAAKTFDAIHERAPALSGAGSWDVFAWRGDEFLFLESKQYRSSDRLNNNQLSWLEAAHDIGISTDCFAVVEYDAGRPLATVSIPALTLAPQPEPTEGLRTELAYARAADPLTRIEHRAAIAAFGSTAVPPMVDWLEDGDLRRFAIGVLEVVARSERSALRPLKLFAASGRPDSDLAEAAVLRVSALRGPQAMPGPRGATYEVYMAVGDPPRAQGPCGIRNADGSACQNPGRHAVDNVWSCTTHFKALTRRGRSL